MTTERRRCAILARMDAAVLITCSVCLRVLDGTTWIEAEEAIANLRTFELPDAPRLEAALCEHCVESIRSRRAPARQLAA